MFNWPWLIRHPWVGGRFHLAEFACRVFGRTRWIDRLGGSEWVGGQNCDDSG
jgi:hypothetical protein